MRFANAKSLFIFGDTISGIRNMTQKQVLSLCCVFLLGLGLRAQEADSKLWMNFALKVPTSEKFSYGGDVGFRHILSEPWLILKPTVEMQQTSMSSGSTRKLT